MAIDERTRYRMHESLRSVHGAEVALTIMEHLPPVGWADVATKHDLRALEQRLELLIDGKVSAAGNRLLLAMLTSNAAMLAAVVALVRT